jgi:ABC-2 type transport system ATP-binding protein
VLPSAEGLSCVEAAIEISGLSKVYASGHKALDGIDLEIRRGEIFALLGPNGAGKTTLIGIVCGLIRKSSGTVKVFGHDNVTSALQARKLVGLVPQELATDAFETVFDTVSFSRGLFGKPPAPAFVEKVLSDLSLADKRKSKIMTLSGGMKRRVMIAKALSHEPTVLFLDEPTAGVDVELRRDMWNVVRRLKAEGVTIILTTHYIDEAEEMADRVGIIDKGKLVLVEEKRDLMQKLGKKRLTLELAAPLAALPDELARFDLQLSADGSELVYSYDTRGERTGITALLSSLAAAGVRFRDLRTAESSLEEIFVSLTGRQQ